MNEEIYSDKELQDNPDYTVDVIIPVYKPDSKFTQLIERLLKQYKRPERILILHTVEDNKDSSGPMDEKEKRIMDWAVNQSSDECKVDIFDINKSQFDHGGTRNYGASLSGADIMLFMTQDAVPADTRLIQSISDNFKNPKVAAAYARQLATTKSGVIEQFTRKFNYPEESYVKTRDDLPKLGIKTYFCSNVCAAYRKTVYDSLGGFVKKTIFNEDMIMAAQIINAGYAIAYSAESRVYHSHSYTYIQQFKRNFDLAVSQKQYARYFSGVKSESEGMKLVKQTLKYLIDQKQYLLIPDLILQSGFKYLGYIAGLNYERLPMDLVRRFSMNPSYWN